LKNVEYVSTVCDYKDIRPETGRIDC